MPTHSGNRSHPVAGAYGLWQAPPACAPPKPVPGGRPCGSQWQTPASAGMRPLPLARADKHPQARVSARRRKQASTPSGGRVLPLASARSCGKRPEPMARAHSICQVANTPGTRWQAPTCAGVRWHAITGAARRWQAPLPRPPRSHGCCRGSLGGPMPPGRYPRRQRRPKMLPIQARQATNAANMIQGASITAR